MNQIIIREHPDRAGTIQAIVVDKDMQPVVAVAVNTGHTAQVTFQADNMHKLLEEHGTSLVLWLHAIPVEFHEKVKGLNLFRGFEFVGAPMPWYPSYKPVTTNEA